MKIHRCQKITQNYWKPVMFVVLQFINSMMAPYFESKNSKGKKENTQLILTEEDPLMIFYTIVQPL